MSMVRRFALAALAAVLCFDDVRHHHVAALKHVVPPRPGGGAAADARACHLESPQGGRRTPHKGTDEATRVVCGRRAFANAVGGFSLFATTTTLTTTVTGGITLLTPQVAAARAEWVWGALTTATTGAGGNNEWTVSKRQESSVRIRPETMLAASDASKREVKLLKVPLGRGAATSFAPDEQIELSRFFSSKQDADKIGAARVAAIFQRSLERQASSPTSPLLGVTVDTASAVAETRRGRRYVVVDYETDGCRRVDEDGACVGRAKRAASTVLTVSLESQARTLEEQRRMDRGDLEERYIDTLWLFTASAPLPAPQKGAAASAAVKKAPTPASFLSPRGVSSMLWYHRVM